MLSFTNEEVRHAFYTVLNADKQISFVKLFESLAYSGYGVTVVDIKKDTQDKLQVVIRINE